MSKKAFVFPGQASQYVGMGEGLYKNSKQAKKIYDQAEDIFDSFSIKETSFKGPLKKLTETEVTQPAIFINSFALFNEIKDKCQPEAVAGHSLGEYTALVAAEAMDFETGLKLVKIRSEQMQKATENSSGTMAAIIGLEYEEVKEILKEMESYGSCVIANYNSHKQIVISGETPAVQEAMLKMKDKGARRAIELSVGGAFHSPLMESARAELKKALDEIDFKEPLYPIYSNVSGEPTTNPDEIRENLNQQLTSSVLWVDTIENMIANDISEFLEIGPGKVLQGLIRRINRDLSTSGISKYKDLENFTCK
ncbi:MAG: ACP S-malonyltransferase [Candidatus Marinimicrobia bacterium]|nr:ACP S-malonyltransferase [Candidatus Neomarinimicrobiota bacterium]